MQTKAKSPPQNERAYSCPNCGKALAMNEKCDCANPVTIVMMISCKENYVAYIDAAGNIRRANER